MQVTFLLGRMHSGAYIIERDYIRRTSYRPCNVSLTSEFLPLWSRLSLSRFLMLLYLSTVLLTAIRFAASLIVIGLLITDIRLSVSIRSTLANIGISTLNHYDKILCFIVFQSYTIGRNNARKIYKNTSGITLLSSTCFRRYPHASVPFRFSEAISESDQR